MIIRHKGIYKDRFEDAPWCGTLIASISCTNNCNGCINDKLKISVPTTIESTTLLDDIKSDIFNEGIILAGLEWTNQPEELYCLISEAIERDLKVILYTHCNNREKLLYKVPSLSDFINRGILVKYGEYDESKRVYNYIDHGVVLATSNQYIEEL